MQMLYQVQVLMTWGKTLPSETLKNGKWSFPNGPFQRQSSRSYSPGCESHRSYSAIQGIQSAVVGDNVKVTFL